MGVKMDVRNENQNELSEKVKSKKSMLVTYRTIVQPA